MCVCVCVCADIGGCWYCALKMHVERPKSSHYSCQFSAFQNNYYMCATHYIMRNTYSIWWGGGRGVIKIYLWCRSQVLRSSSFENRSAAAACSCINGQRRLQFGLNKLTEIFVSNTHYVILLSSTIMKRARSPRVEQNNNSIASIRSSPVPTTFFELSLV